MIIYNTEEINIREHRLIDAIKNGRLFIYPTDTIYGVGCNAKNSKSVQKIRQLKERPANPFSVIAPSVGWIKENCQVNSEAEEWLKKLPGPYTLIMNLKKRECISKEVNSGIETIGVRIPDHWISKLLANANVPFVTTSVNKSGQEFMTSLEDLNDEIKQGVDFVLYEGKKEGKPSKIVDLTGKIKMIER